MSFKHFFLTVLLTLTPMQVWAQTHDHHAMEPAVETKVVDYYAKAMETMHKDMMVAPTGDADVDFVRGMIPHHQGAIDMAKVLQEKGSDPELKKLASDIITAQEKETAFMKAWLAKHGD